MAKRRVYFILPVKSNISKYSGNRHLQVLGDRLLRFVLIVLRHHGKEERYLQVPKALRIQILL